jgi:hypothetical protein
MCTLSDLPTEFLLTPEITLVPASTVLRHAENGNQELRLITRMLTGVASLGHVRENNFEDLRGVFWLCPAANCYHLHTESHGDPLT